jgi:hypothetical protein
MDDEDNTPTTLMGSQIRDALSAVPEEVQTFMWSNEYDVIINSIQKVLSLDDKQRDLVKYGGYQLLMGMKTMEDLSKEWVAAGMSQENALKALYAVHENILITAQNITEFFTKDPDNPSEYDLDEEEEVETVADDVNNAPAKLAPATGLESLADRLKQASIATPSRRDYSLNGISNAPAADDGKKTDSSDLYREQIEP